MKTIKPKYSGDKSIKFWERINSFCDDRFIEWQYIYDLGVALQNIEDQLLRLINKQLEEIDGGDDDGE